MAKYRPVHTKVWSDPHFIDLPPEGKLVFLYLITNANTTESGIYPCSLKEVSFATSVPLEKVKELFSKNKIFLRMVAYDSENQVVFVKNFLRYNGRGRPDLLRKSIKEDMTTINTHLWQDFLQKYPQFINIWQSTQEVVSGSFSKAGSNSSTNSSNDTNNFNIVDHVEVVEAGHNGSSSKPDQEEPDNGSSSQKMIVPLYPEDGKKKRKTKKKTKTKIVPIRR